jgi:hypothetical protein
MKSSLPQQGRVNGTPERSGSAWAGIPTPRRAAPRGAVPRIAPGDRRAEGAREPGDRTPPRPSVLEEGEHPRSRLIFVGSPKRFWLALFEDPLFFRTLSQVPSRLRRSVTWGYSGSSPSGTAATRPLRRHPFENAPYGADYQRTPRPFLFGLISQDPPQTPRSGVFPLEIPTPPAP